MTTPTFVFFHAVGNRHQTLALVCANEPVFCASDFSFENVKTDAGRHNPVAAKTLSSGEPIMHILAPFSASAFCLFGLEWDPKPALVFLLNVSVARVCVALPPIVFSPGGQHDAPAAARGHRDGGGGRQADRGPEPRGGERAPGADHRGREGERRRRRGERRGEGQGVGADGAPSDRGAAARRFAREGEQPKNRLAQSRKHSLLVKRKGVDMFPIVPRAPLPRSIAARQQFGTYQLVGCP